MSFLVFCSKEHLIQPRRSGKSAKNNIDQWNFVGIESRPDHSWKCCPKIPSGCDLALSSAFLWSFSGTFSKDLLIDW